MTRKGREQGGGRRVRPKKPYPDFPLFPHATGRWAKKIRGRFAFFGPWEDPLGALDRYVAQRDDLYAGRVPRPTRVESRIAGRAAVLGLDGPASMPGGATATSSLTIRGMVNQFLSAKQRRVDSGEMGRRSFADYHTACKLVVEAFGVHRLVTDLTPADFGQFRASLTKTRGPVALGNQINRVRSVFKFAFDAGLIEKPVRFGPEFIRPSMRAVRVAKRNNGPRLFEREEVHGLLKVASPALKAMILLGVNCGLGNTDIAELQRSMLDLKAGTLDFRRPKTGIARRGCLWPETIRAIRAYLKERREPVDDADSDTLFITKYGQRWVRVREPGEKSRRTGTSQIVVTDSVGLEFGKLVRTTNMQRPGRSFYALRHTFRTIADEVNDRRAIDLCMGHESTADIATAYVERIDEERIKRVAEHVRRWLYNEAHATENR